MARSMSGWIETLSALARRGAVRFLRAAIAPELHVTLVIARAASRARVRPYDAGHLVSRTER